MDLNIPHIAQLARLALTPEETALYQSQLGQILDYVEQLRQVDVSAVEPTAHAFPLTNVTRPDESRPGFSVREALANAPRAAGDLFIVTKVVE